MHIFFLLCYISYQCSSLLHYLKPVHRQSLKVTSTAFTTIRIPIHMTNLNPDMAIVDMCIVDLHPVGEQCWI